MTVAEAINLIKRTLPKGNSAIDIQLKEALTMVISALEKQVAKKPIGISLTHEQRVGNCPCCNKLVGSLIDDDICAKCGQKLDWSEI